MQKKGIGGVLYMANEYGYNILLIYRINASADYS